MRNLGLQLSPSMMVNPAGDLTELRPGQIVNARVVAQLAHGMVRLQVAKLSIDARSSAPLKLGQSLSLKVEQEGGTLRFRLLQPGTGSGARDSTSGGPSVRAGAASHTSANSGTKALTTTTQSPSAEGNPAPARPSSAAPASSEAAARRLQAEKPSVGGSGSAPARWSSPPNYVPGAHGQSNAKNSSNFPASPSSSGPEARLTSPSGTPSQSHLSSTVPPPAGKLITPGPPMASAARLEAATATEANRQQLNGTTTGAPASLARSSATATQGAVADGQKDLMPGIKQNMARVPQPAGQNTATAALKATISSTNYRLVGPEADKTSRQLRAALGTLADSAAKAASLPEGPRHAALRLLSLSPGDGDGLTAVIGKTKNDAPALGARATPAGPTRSDPIPSSGGDRFSTVGRSALAGSDAKQVDQPKDATAKAAPVAPAGPAAAQHRQAVATLLNSLRAVTNHIGAEHSPIARLSGAKLLAGQPPGRTMLTHGQAASLPSTRLFSAAEQLARSPTHSIPAEIKAAAQALSRIPHNLSDLGDANGVRNAVSQSGLFYETQLAQGNMPALSADHKASLLLMRNLLRSWLGTDLSTQGRDTAKPMLAPPTPQQAELARTLLNHTENSLAHLRIAQFAARPDQGDPGLSTNLAARAEQQEFHLSLPVLHEGQARWIELDIERRGASNAAGDHPLWQIRIVFDFEPFGPTSALLSLQGKKLTVSIRTINNNIKSLFKESEDLLKGMLQEEGLEVDDIRFSQGPVFSWHQRNAQLDARR